MNTRNYYNLTGKTHELAYQFFNTLNTTNATKQTISFIQSLDTIRILLDNGVAFGNQAASTNLIDRLREMGFKGVIELIYPSSIREKLPVLFDVSIKNSEDFFDEVLKIRFIVDDAFLKQRSHQKIQPISLGMTGALDLPYVKSLKYMLLDAKQNFTSFESIPADYLNVNAFLRFASYHGDYYRSAPEIVDNEIVLRNQPYPIRQVDTRYQTLIRSQTSNNAVIKNFLGTSTQFSSLLSAVDKEEINVLPIYGYPTIYPHILLNILLGTRYAQLNGLCKPAIITLMYDLPPKNLLDLEALISSDSNPLRVKEMISNFSLAKAFRFMPLSNLNSSTISTLSQKDLIVTATGKLPKDFFNYFYTYPAMLPPIFEGASTYSLLINSRERPHLLCGGVSPYWALNFSSASIELRYQFMNLTQYICGAPGSARGWHEYDTKRWLNCWRERNIAEMIGKYFIEAQNPNSELSIFFKQHFSETLKSDRIMSGLMPAVRLANMTDTERQAILEPILCNVPNEWGIPISRHINSEKKDESLSVITLDAIGHGVISGASNTLKYALQRKGFSNTFAERTGQVAYLVTMFTYDFCRSFTNKNSFEDLWSRATTSAYEAGINTAKLLAVQVGALVASKIANNSSPTSRIGRAVRFVSNHARLSMFAVRTAQNPEGAIVSIVAGGISEAGASSSGKVLVDQFVPKRTFP